MLPMLVFVHINKTAGTTVRYILRSSYGARHCDVEPWEGTWSDRPFSTPDLLRVRRIYPRLVSIAGHRITGHEDLQAPGIDFRYFTFLRDPVSMCASRFQYQIGHRKKKHLVFEKWIQSDWVRNAQTKRIAGTANAGDAISMIDRREMFVGLTELFDESLVLLKAVRAPDLDIRYARVNVAKSSTVAKELLSNAATREMIVEANRADLELYDYVRRDLYPAFRREYGASLDDAVAEYRSTAEAKFNRRNLLMCRVKQYALHRSMLHLYRGKRSRTMVERVLR
jgi:Galactose-3-O-sulfotransferase